MTSELMRDPVLCRLEPRCPRSPDWKPAARLTPCSRFGRRVLKVGRDPGQGSRDSVSGFCIDAIEEATPNARKVNGPCGLQFGPAPWSKPRNVAACVGGACRLRHEAPRLEIVHQAGHPARRKVGGVGQVGHPQFAIGSFGKVHDRRVLARCQAGASDQVAVQMSREDFDNSHYCAPEHFLSCRERFDGAHAVYDNLLRQAIFVSLTQHGATALRFHHCMTRRSQKARCIA